MKKKYQAMQQQSKIKNNWIRIKTFGKNAYLYYHQARNIAESLLMKRLVECSYKINERSWEQLFIALFNILIQNNKSGFKKILKTNNIR